MLENLAETNTQTPIKLKTTPRDFFGHLLGFGMLYAAVVSFLTLIFQSINVRFPDALNFYYSGALTGIRWASSVLIIVWPVHILLAWLIGKDYKVNPQKRELWVRRWLVYLTLFVTAVTIIIDMATLVYNLYGGEITTRFILKVIAVLIVAGVVFWYFVWDLRRKQVIASSTPKTFAWVVSVVILAVLVTGFFIAGSPSQQRAIQFDQQRVSDLQSIQSEIVTYWQKKGTIPASLAELTNNISGFTAPVDPQTKTPYEYQGLSNLSFELCATFQASSLNNPNSYPTAPITPKGGTDNWQHESGRICFTRNIDPQLYKPLPVQ